MSKSSTIEQLFTAYQKETRARIRKGRTGRKHRTGTFSPVKSVRRVYWLKRRDMQNYSSINWGSFGNKEKFS